MAVSGSARVEKCSMEEELSVGDAKGVMLHDYVVCPFA
jgi:hypothetical protein